MLFEAFAGFTFWLIKTLVVFYSRYVLQDRYSYKSVQIQRANRMYTNAKEMIPYLLKLSKRSI